jgi:hypothetical protein
LSSQSCGGRPSTPTSDTHPAFEAHYRAQLTLLVAVLISVPVA